MDQAKNFAKATVADNYEASATAIDVITGHGGRLPPVPFNAVWWNATDYPDPADDPGVEIVRVTDVTGDTLTITRAQEGTAAEDHNLAGKTYFLVAGLTARAVNNLRSVIAPNGTNLILGDALLGNNETRIEIDDDNSQIRLIGVSGVVVAGLFAIAGNQFATGPVGNVVAKVTIYGADMALLGYLPIYDSIT